MSSNRMEYELWEFDHPALEARRPSEWTSAEAKLNASRLASMVPDRVQTLLNFLQIEEGLDADSLLAAVDQKMALLSKGGALGAMRPTAYGSFSAMLSPAGVCMCVDAGLLVCQLLMQEFGELLEIRARTKTRSTDAYRNQAELVAGDWDLWQRFSIVWMAGVEGAGFIERGLHPNRGFTAVYRRHRGYAVQSQKKILLGPHPD